MTGQAASPQLELRDYLGVLRRRRWVIALTALVITSVAVAASLLQTPVYEGTAELLLQPRSTESLFDPNSGQRNDPARAVQTEIRVLESQPVQDAVRKKLGAAHKVSASPVGLTDVIEVRATSIHPRRAAEVANAYATAYIEFRRKQSVEGILTASKEVQDKVDDLQKQLDDLATRVGAAAPPERLQVEQRVAGQREALLTQQILFNQKLDELQVDSALKTGGAQLVTPAAVPVSPFKPTPRRTAVMGLLVGLLLGAGLAFLRDYLDDSVKSKDDLARVVGGLPNLALVPPVPGWKDRAKPLVVSTTDPKSPAAEAYRSLRTSIQFLGLDRPLRTIQVTSASASEGKSTTIANLGVALAQAGQRVVIVCCDLRQPRIHEFFGLDNAKGFTSVLLGDVSLSAALQEVAGQDHLRLLASGPVPPNPSELLSGRRTVDVLTALQAECDVVLVDCPPILPVTDAAVLSNRVDATLLVVTAGITTGKELQRSLELLNQVGAPIIGTVLNGVRGEHSYGYSYRYSSDHDEEKKGRAPLAAKG